jgi:predicted metalloprotease
MDTSNSTWSRRITQLVVVAAAAVTVSAGMTATAGATEQAAPATASQPSYTVEEYIGFVAADADRYWTTWFTSNGYREPFVELAVIPPGGSYATDCSGGPAMVTSDHPNAYYCPADGDGLTWNGQLLPDDQGALILPVVTMQKMWTGDIFGKQSAVAGDFAAAVVIAHEFGHHVQDEWLDQYNAGRTDGVLAAPNDKWDELIADCFAGNWVRSAYDAGILEPGDIEEAIAALEVLGDTAPSPHPHGSGPERRAALELGINTGSPTDCANSYWVVDPNGQP